ncbi:hypothetical protein GQ602_005156 [Ophiocordyceps camponoti-floridani]|uniref:Secreted protein n=1 Tax=Ophiocordyceps camponoti-floridani TaxID=2030778 RepID=A0A8H4Q587_9HYPO|nr:hypothetical protein GQ602_005156 [Ophiocordyceps camponoti-floridani]
MHLFQAVIFSLAILSTEASLNPLEKRDQNPQCWRSQTRCEWLPCGYKLPLRATIGSVICNPADEKNYRIAAWTKHHSKSKTCIMKTSTIGHPGWHCCRAYGDSCLSLWIWNDLFKTLICETTDEETLKLPRPESKWERMRYGTENRCTKHWLRK